MRYQTVEAEFDLIDYIDDILDCPDIMSEIEDHLISNGWSSPETASQFSEEVKDAIQALHELAGHKELYYTNCWELACRELS